MMCLDVLVLRLPRPGLIRIMIVFLAARLELSPALGLAFVVPRSAGVVLYFHVLVLCFTPAMADHGFGLRRGSSWS